MANLTRRIRRKAYPTRLWTYIYTSNTPPDTSRYVKIYVPGRILPVQRRINIRPATYPDTSGNVSYTSSDVYLYVFGRI